MWSEKEFCKFKILGLIVMSDDDSSVEELNGIRVKEHMEQSNMCLKTMEVPEDAGPST